MGYPSVLAAKYLSSRFYKTSYATLIDVHAYLINYFSHKEIIKVASHTGGANNLAAIKNHYDLLREWDFSKDNIFKMVNHNGGSKNLEAVKANHEVLREFGFSKDDNVKMASRHGGSAKIAVVLQQAKPLKERGFTNPLIIKALYYLGASSLHPEVTLETIQAQLALCKQFIRLRNDFFRYFEDERMHQLACYRHPDSNHAFSAILDFAQTDSQVSTSQALARLFAQQQRRRREDWKSTITTLRRKAPWSISVPIVPFMSFWRVRV